MVESALMSDYVDEEDSFLCINSSDSDLNCSDQIATDDRHPQHHPTESAQEKSSLFKIEASCIQLSPDAVQQRRQQYIEKVCSLVGSILSSLRFGADSLDSNLIGNEEIIEAVLVCKCWDCDIVVQEFIDRPKALLKAAGFPPDEFCSKLSALEGKQERSGSGLECCFTDENINPQGGGGEEEVEFNVMCPILCMDVPVSATTSLLCGHMASNEAWRQYLTTKIDEGGVVGAKCMICPEPVPLSVVKVLLGSALFQKWEERLLNNFIAQNTLYRFCPGPQCNRVTMLDKQARLTKGRVTYNLPVDIECSTNVVDQGGCGMKYCFQCCSEPHRPIPCEILMAWDIKNRGEAENMTWIFVNTKTCPKCREPIEKNLGCMHMTCRCGHEFCWLCLDLWKKHGLDGYRCNAYVETGNLKKQAAQNLEKYSHFFERYRAHNQGQHIAENKLKGLVEYQQEDGKQVDTQMNEMFYDLLKKAINQIIEGRKMLKNSYAFGYFAEWEVDSDKSGQGKLLFEHQQGELEWTLDKLHGLTEKLEAESKHIKFSNDPAFEGYNRLLSNLTKVVRDFFVKMTTVFESEVIQDALPCSLPLTDEATVKISANDVNTAAEG